MPRGTMTMNSTRTVEEETEEQWQREHRRERLLDNHGFHGDEDVPLFLGEMEDELQLRADNMYEPEARRRYVGTPVAETPVGIADPAVRVDEYERRWHDWMDE